MPSVTNKTKRPLLVPVPHGKKLPTGGAKHRTSAGGYISGSIHRSSDR
jgi:hypothetical protein